MFIDNSNMLYRDDRDKEEDINIKNTYKHSKMSYKHENVIKLFVCQFSYFSMLNSKPMETYGKPMENQCKPV